MTLDGWTSVTVEQCCDILDSKRVPVNGEDREKRIGEIPYYGANGLQGYIDDFIFDEPLILIAEDGGTFDEFATRPIAYRINGKSWVNNHAHVLRAKEAFDQDAVFYSLEHKDIQSFIVGGTRSKLNQSALRAISFSLPSAKPEQTKIAEVLSTVDRAIEQTEALIAKQQRIKTGLMQDLLTRGIDEHGNLRSEQTHNFKDSPLGRIPVEWEVKRLEALTQKIGDGIHTTPIYSENTEFFFINGNNLGDGSVHISLNTQCVDEKEYRKYFIDLNEYTILYSINGTVGNIAFYNNEAVILGKSVAYIKCKKTNNVRFIYYALQSEYVKHFHDFEMTGSTIHNLSLAAVRATPIKIPLSESEQVMIVKRLDGLARSIADAIFNLSKLRAVKTALMQDLLTGKKRVSALLNDTEFSL